MKILIVFGFFAVAHSFSIKEISFKEVSQEEWNNFKTKFGKKYENPKDEGLRYKIYLENRYDIAKHNLRYHNNEVTFRMEINKFSDMTLDEVNEIYKGFSLVEESQISVFKNMSNKAISFILPANAELHESVDWRDSGAVTPVKDQGQCGSCWSFSSTGALEGQHFRKTGKLVSLSEQNLVDCSGSYGNKGCKGGWMHKAFQYIKDNNGIDTEDSYPYEAQVDSCRFNEDTVGATDSDFVFIPKGDENALMHAVATIGPISVAIDTNHVSFKHYASGVYFEPQCSQTDLDHAVLIVGYGTDESSNQDYWLVKNSWSENWGDKGYIKMARNRNNNCGIVTYAVYPTV